MKQNCSNCRFSHPEEEDLKARDLWEEDNPGPLFCRRYAPRPMKNDGEDTATEWTWPIVWKENWCGEWAAPREAD